jgi:putative protease
LALPEQSPLPLGIVLTGNWPLCISRIIAPGFKIEQPFTSPKGERAWIKMYQDMFWMYPAWEMNLREHKEALNKAGYTVFVNLKEPLPKGVSLKKRPGLWNWKINLR